MLFLLFFISLAIVGLVFWPVLWSFNMKKEDVIWYNSNVYQDTNKRVRKVMLAPPSWIFPIAWFILYCLIASAMVLYALSITDYLALPGKNLGNIDVPTTYMTIFAIFFVNITFNHNWIIIFFNQRNTKLAAVIAFIIAGTAIAINVLFGMESQWTPFWLFIPYSLWTTFAFCLNLNWIFSTSQAQVATDVRCYTRQDVIYGQVQYPATHVVYK